MWQEFFAAIGLLLVFEGIMPFINPKSFREAMLRASQIDDKSLRFIGLTLMLVGVGLLYWVRS